MLNLLKSPSSIRKRNGSTKHSFEIWILVGAFQSRLNVSYALYLHQINKKAWNSHESMLLSLHFCPPIFVLLLVSQVLLNWIWSWLLHNIKGLKFIFFFVLNYKFESHWFSFHVKKVGYESNVTQKWKIITNDTLITKFNLYDTIIQI